MVTTIQEQSIKQVLIYALSLVVTNSVLDIQVLPLFPDLNREAKTFKTKIQ
jgi:hypothetical protein